MTLDEARDHIGDGVAYQPFGGKAEDGVITGVSDCFVFVRYRGDQISKATAAEMLTLLATRALP
jgi:hypothetical protein